MPKNCAASGTGAGDKVLRFLDCAVVDYSIRTIAETQGTNYQTVRGVWLHPSRPHYEYWKL